MRRILIVTQYIYPESFKSSELAFELSKRGYQVDVLTGIPNYPEGKYYSGYGLFKKRKEVVSGVTFYRCLQTPRKLLPGAMGLMLNYLTFMVNATLWVVLYFAWQKNYDVIIAHEPSPITQIIPACILGDIKKVPVYSWIQDIWPDALVSAGGKCGHIMAPMLDKITDWIYRHSTKLLITSRGMAPLINRNADYSDKIIYYPQWSEDMMANVEGERKNIEIVSNSDYCIMMAGTLNSAIGVSSVLALCDEMKYDAVRFIFVGGGSEEQSMRDYAREKHINNILFTGRKPFSEMPLYIQQADAMLLSLKKTDMRHLDITVPARLQSYLSAGKPVLAMIGSGATDIIKEADCGYAVPAGDYKALAELIRTKVLVNKEGMIEKGKNGRKYFEEYFTKELCIENLCKIIEE